MLLGAPTPSARSCRPPATVEGQRQLVELGPFAPAPPHACTRPGGAPQPVECLARARAASSPCRLASTSRSRSERSRTAAAPVAGQPFQVSVDRGQVAAAAQRRLAGDSRPRGSRHPRTLSIVASKHGFNGASLALLSWRPRRSRQRLLGAALRLPPQPVHTLEPESKDPGRSRPGNRPPLRPPALLDVNQPPGSAVPFLAVATKARAKEHTAEQVGQLGAAALER